MSDTSIVEGGWNLRERFKLDVVEYSRTCVFIVLQFGDTGLLEETFEALAPSGQALVARFYEEAFSRHPGVIPLFEHLPIEEQQGKLLAALVTVVNALNQPETLVEEVTAAPVAPVPPQTAPAARSTDASEWEDF